MIHLVLTKPEVEALDVAICHLLNTKAYQKKTWYKRRQIYIRLLTYIRGNLLP